MKQNESSMTSLISSFSRAYHSENDTPVIFNDYLAKDLLTSTEYMQIQQYMIEGFPFFATEEAKNITTDAEKLNWVVQTQLAPTPLARAAYTESVIANEAQLGLRQYVILGAGMDTFAFRKGNNLDVFEVDHPNTQAFKLERIKQAELALPPNLHMIAADFTKDDDIQERLLDAGFNPEVKTVFSLLGVTYYLNKHVLQQLFAQLSKLMVKGSSILFDYADQGLFTSNVKRVQNTVALAKQSGEPMQATYDSYELASMLQDHGLLMYEHLTPEDIQTTFFADRTDALSAFEHMHYVHAVYQGKN